MNLVKGDKVIVIAGRDKGKTGTIQKKPQISSLAMPPYLRTFQKVH